MKRYYEKQSLLSRLLEWLFTAVLVVWLVRLGLAYLKQHIVIVIVIAIIIVGSIVLYRIYDYKRRNRY